jgi:hypothetical protein
VTLDAYQGALLTHFGGIPEGSRVCGWLTNRGTRPVAWVRLRLRSTTGAGDQRIQLASHWIFREPIAPGETVAFALEEPPVAEGIQLGVAQTGREGSRVRSGRTAARAKDCSRPWLDALLAADSESRPTADLGSIPLERPGAEVPANLLAVEP